MHINYILCILHTETITKTMTELTKKDLLLILNTYQNYINDFVNISDDDLNNIYINVAKNDLILNNNYQYLKR